MAQSQSQDGVELLRRRGESSNRLANSRFHVILDQDRRITSVSKAAAGWFGARDPGALIGADAQELLPHTSPMFAVIESSFATGKRAWARFDSELHPGQVVEAESSPCETGVRVCWGESARSRTKPRTRQSAQPSGGRAPGDDFEFRVDRSWRITSITESAAAWAGSTVDNLVGRDGREVNPAATQVLAGAIDAALRRGATSTLEQPSTHVPGRWVRVEVAPSQGGACIRFADITAELPAEKAPGVAEEAGAFSLGEGPAEIALINRRGVIVAVNAAWRAGVVSHGLNLADAGVGVRYAEVARTAVPNSDVASFQDRLNELFAGRVSQIEATYGLDGPDGEVRRQVQIAPLRIGHATHFLAIHENLTERAKVLAALLETSDQLLHAQEQERQRIAVELHDSMGQHLAGMVLGLTNLRRLVGQDPAAAQGQIDEMMKLTQQAAREMRVLSFLMNASGEKRESLEASVRRFVVGFGRRTGLAASVDAEGSVDEIDAATHHAVFRVIQEALSNVHRHAHASSVSVLLACQRGMLTVRISDDGRGIRMAPQADAGEVALGVGIMGMRARIEQLGGTLEITGDAGGTVVAATVPVVSL